MKYKPGCPSVVRRQLIEYADYLRKECYSDLAKRSISLVVDRMTWNGCSLCAVIAFTRNRLYFLDIIHVMETDHTTIATAIAMVVQELEEYETKVRSIVTDNAANLCRTFDDSNTADTLSAILHIRCGVHTAHLVYSDLEQSNECFINLYMIYSLA
jgi:hypothetical protein